VLGPDVAEPAGDHDGLVIAAHFAAPGPVDLELESAEVAGDAGAPELVVEGRAADRRFEHDVERRGDSFRLRRRAELPGTRQIRQAQMRHTEAGEARFRLAAAARRAFVAYFAARSRGRTRVRRDG